MVKNPYPYKHEVIILIKMQVKYLKSNVKCLSQKDNIPLKYILFDQIPFNETFYITFM